MPTYVRTQEVTHPVGLDGEVRIGVFDGDLRLRAIDGDQASVRITFSIRAESEGDADRILQDGQFDILRQPGMLSVRERKQVLSFEGVGPALSRLFGGGEGRIGASLEADLPAGARIQVEGVSADLDASGFTGAQKYQTVSGDLSIGEAGGSLKVDTVSGDLNVQGGAPIELRIHAVSGDVRIVTPLLRALRAGSVSGDMNVEAALDPRGEFSIQTVSGDLSFGLAGAAVFDVRSLSTDISSEIDYRLEGRADRRRVIIGRGGPNVVFSTMSGDLTIERPRRIEAPLPADAAAPAGSTEVMDVLGALERGEIDVDEAARRLGPSGS